VPEGRAPAAGTLVRPARYLRDGEKASLGAESASGKDSRRAIIPRTAVSMPNVVLRRRALLVRGLRIAVPQVTILAVLAGSLALPAAGAGYSRSALDGAEQAVITGVNKYRAEVGLRRLLLD
jgi:hypothetical protein